MGLTASRPSQLSYGSLISTRRQLCCLFLLRQSISCACVPLTGVACLRACLFSSGFLTTFLGFACRMSSACHIPIQFGRGSNSATATCRWRKTFATVFDLISNHTRVHMQTRANTQTHIHTHTHTHTHTTTRYHAPRRPWEF